MSETDESKPGRQEIDVADCLPEAWRARRGAGFMRAYLMPGMPREGIHPPFAADLGDVCVVLGWIGLPQLGIAADYKHEPEGGVHIVLTTPSRGEPRDPGPISMFFTILDERGPEDTYAAARVRIHEAVGFMGTWSHLFAFEHLEDYNVDFSDDVTLNPASTLVARSRLWADALVIGPQLSAAWSANFRAIAHHPEGDRIRLSLRWLDDGKRADGVDAFLRLWVALETLAMPDDTNIAPLRDALKAIYGVVSQDAEATFGIGRIFGMRGRIVHNGERIEPPELLLKYLGEIYVDVLALKYGTTANDRAKAVLDEAGGVENLLPAALGGRGEEFEAERRKAAEEAARGAAADADEAAAEDTDGGAES